MRKLIYFILILPILAVLAHDVYFFVQNQDKGFRLSDSGWLWSTYHPETHDNWKITLKEYEDKVKDAVPLDKIAAMIPAPPMEEEGETTDEIQQKIEVAKQAIAGGEDEELEEGEAYTEEFIQKDGEEGSEVISPAVMEEQKASEKAILQNHIGFLLEQKAVIVFFGLLVVIYLIDLILFQMIFGLLFFRKSKSKKYSGGRHKSKRGKRLNY